jgi:hypothetical protein
MDQKAVKKDRPMKTITIVARGKSWNDALDAIDMAKRQAQERLFKEISPYPHPKSSSTPELESLLIESHAAVAVLQENGEAPFSADDKTSIIEGNIIGQSKKRFE